MEREFKIGQRVESTEVSPYENPNDHVGQVKQLEIVEFLDDGKVKCKHWREDQVSPKVEEHIVSLGSLKYISDEPLKYKGLGDDPFWKKNRQSWVYILYHYPQQFKAAR